jgi:hypothetical protein
MNGRRRSGFVAGLAALAVAASVVVAVPGVSAGPVPAPMVSPTTTFEGFADVPGGRYFSTPVNWAGSAGVTNGVGNGSFGRIYGPTRTIIRAEFITWVYRLSGDTTDYPDAGFTDVVRPSFYADAVDWAKATGVTGGVGDGTRFGTSNPITRAQILLFLWRAAGEPTVSEPSGLSDVPETAGFYDAVNWGVATGVTTGVGSTGKFLPANSATRAEAITMLYRSEFRDVGIDDGHDQAVRINEIQTMGSHNSYRFRPPAALFDRLLGLGSSLAGLGLDARELDYAARPLDVQFGRLGVRQIELDVFADPNGGLYANRVFNAFPGVGLPVASGEPALNEPGFKVLHIQDLDYATHCLTFVDCLTQVREWSLANPTHLPIMILVEVKSDAIPSVLGFSPAVPVPVGAAELDALDAEIRSVFDDAHIITPDSVRNAATTLREAVTTTGWPTLAAGRGKVMFGLDNASGPVRDAYFDGRANLEGRAMFAEATSQAADGAAFFKYNSPSSPLIEQAIAAGFMVRTRADGPFTSLLDVNNETRLAPRGVTTRRQAWVSGATWLSSDYLEPTDSSQALIRGNGFTSYLPGGGVARCNPVKVNPACDNSLLQADLPRSR